MFKAGKREANNPAFEGHYHKTNNAVGHQAEYVVVSDVTIELIKATLTFRGSCDRTNDTKWLLWILRESWIKFMVDPALCISQLRRDAKKWTSGKVESHFIG